MFKTLYWKHRQKELGTHVYVSHTLDLAEQHCTFWRPTMYLGYQTTISTRTGKWGGVIVAALDKTAQSCRIFNHSGKISLLQHEHDLEDLAYLIR